MKIVKLKIGIAVASLLFITQGYSQQNNVVSAAIAYQKFEPALMQQDAEGAKKHITEAKSLIDAAMLNESTADDSKANYYNVLINFGMISLASMDEDESLEVYRTEGDSLEKVLKESIAKANTKNRWKRELADYFNRQTSQAIMIGEMMFKQKKYDMAFAGFAGAYQIKKMADIEEEREAMETNAIISARNYIDTLERSGENDKAIEFVSNALEMFPTSEDLAIAGVNLALNNEDLEKAEEFFKAAAVASPKNKVLFSNMGSIYLTEADKEFAKFNAMSITDDGYAEKSELVESLYAKAEKNLKHAIEIDPNYAEASYNLGVLYLSRAEKLKNTAGQMDFNNPDYDKVSAKSTEMYEKAIEPLETYIKQDPENVGVLNVLFQVHRNLGNSEKALDYKKRADALK